MFLHELLKEWPRDRSFKQLLRSASDLSGSGSAVTGIGGSAAAFLQAGLVETLNCPAVVVAADLARAEKIYEDLLAFLPPGRVGLLPARELFITADFLARSMEQRRQRLFFLERLQRRESAVFVAPFTALISRVLPPQEWRRLLIPLQVGEGVDREILLQKLIENGYERVPLIEGRGQCSARGEIIDIFPPGRERPLRVELFGEIIDSIRFFDPATQRSTERLDQVVILPAYELVISGARFEQGEQRIRRELEPALARLRRRGEEQAAAKLKTSTGRHLNRLLMPGGLDHLSSYFSYFYGEGASLFDYLPTESIVLVDEPAAIFKNAAGLHRELLSHYGSIFARGEMLPGADYPFWQIEELLSPRSNIMALSLFPSSTGSLELSPELVLSGRDAASYHGQWELLGSDLAEWRKAGYRIAVAAATEERARGLRQLLAEQGLKVGPLSGQPWAPGEARMVTAILEGGFLIPSLKLAVVTEHNILPRRRKKRRLTRQEGSGLHHYRDLAVGDYVVHEQHGIGKYLGLNTLEIGGVQRDYLLIKYQGSDRLYLPADQIELIQKYIGAEGKAPRLHRLGGGEWQRLKSRVKASVEEMAQELLSLYAARELADGYRFKGDHPWQKEFEMLFPYEETTDQLQAIAEVKADLEKDHPMDRLICGDVGYGKTEVALRAAFKVVMEGKQVAMLVPTTVLSQQHFRTFSERFAEFPFQVAQLSRFVSLAEQKKILQDLADGKIDIVIGTHRLLSKDIKFRDLGLLIIDEEQRFGVRHKEKLKQMRLSVDVLAMTATPIPRTMHLSLVGVRDLSVIETPPENRYPVQTFVAEYSDHLAREAIQRELNRGGQVYVVFNRIAGINAMAEQIRELFPGAAVAVGHGRIPEATLEQLMDDFIEGKYQILVSTTIIEAGLDIPNVNTLLVYDADQFGLAQLYQLRGRVGRSHRLAYAYLTYRREKIITEDARKRLQAIKEFTELGSGFKVALRDLEIRGSGNILGAEQHGFMVEIGFDLYSRLLEEAVARIKERPPKEEPLPPPRLDLKLNAYLPTAYITNQGQKIDLYKRIYTLTSESELREIEEEIRDRYGSPPPPVQNLLQAASLRIAALQLGICLLEQDDGVVKVKFYPGRKPDRLGLGPPVRRGRRRVHWIDEETLGVRIQDAAGKAALPELSHFLKELSGELPEEVALRQKIPDA
ncbi:MAG: transcription-repair coupling factor [Firmicutes bacterium]|nr:transcription-repair coupling factor [Bacillota bacterium]